MASQQLKRENKDEDPKVTSRFESLTVKESPGDQPTTIVHQITEILQGGAEIQKGAATQQGQHKSMQRKQDEGPSLEEISKYRATAQQNSMEAIRAAQEKYQKSKENMSKSSSQQTKNYSQAPQIISAGQRGEGVSSATSSPESLEKSSQTPGLMDVTKQRASYVGEAARTSRDVVMETGNTAAEYMGKGAGVVRDAAVVGGSKAAELAGGVTESVQQLGDVVAGLIDTTADATTQGAAVTLDSGTTVAQYVGKAAGVLKDVTVVAGWNAAKLASDTAVGAMESMEDVSNQAAAGAIDTTVDMSAKWTNDVKEAGLETGKATAEYARKGADAMKDVAAKSVDMSKQGASVVGETGKDVAIGAARSTAEYASKAAAVLKDVAVVAGWNTAKFASKKATDAKETLEDVSGQAEDVTAGVINKAVDFGEKGASYAGETAVAGKDLTIETGKKTGEYVRKGTGVVKDVASKSMDTALEMSGQTATTAKDATLGAVKTTAEFAGKAAGVIKDATVVGGWNTAEFASNKVADAIETMGNVSRQAEDVTAEIIDRTVDISEKGVNYIGQTAIAGKDLALETGKTTVEYARMGSSALGDVASGLVDTTLDMGQEGATYAGETVDKTGGGIGGQRAESGASGGVRLDINNRTSAANKGAMGMTDRGGFEHQKPGPLIVEGHFEQKGPAGVKEQRNFKLQESGGVVEGSLEHHGTEDSSGAMRMIGKTLMDAGDNKDTKIRRGG